MFYLSSKVEYGILGVLALARHSGSVHLSVRAIAEKENLSPHFLEQAMSRLKEKGLVESVRGAYGGYRLTREPKEIKLSDLILAIEGEPTSSSKSAIINEILSGVETAVDNHLNGIDFEYLARRFETLEQKEALMFHI